MLPKEKVNLKYFGYVKLLEEGKPDQELCVWTKDIVTTVGKERAASHLANTPANTWFTQIALGTNDDEESTEDLALGAEIYKVDLSTVWANGQTVFGNKIIEANDIGVDSYTLWEIGLLNASDDLIARQVFASSITFTGNQKLDFLWGVIVS